MLIPIGDIQDIFLKITQQLNIDYTSVLIFTSLDADSVCTLRILARLLKSENIHYKVYPIQSYKDFDIKIQQSKTYQRVKLFFFINCGGTIDLTQKWFHEKAQVFLFDANKPIYHKNIEDPNIRVIDDGQGQLQNYPTTQEINKYEQIQQMVEDQLEIQQQKESEDDQVSPKRRSKYQMSQKLKKQRNILNKKINSYYGKSYFSLPSSFITYKLARQLNKIDNEYLWYAMVGVTAMFIQQKLSKENLQNINNTLNSDMIKLNQSTKQTMQKGKINKKYDYQFTLLRYWSLYESMVNSPYIITKFKLWEDKDHKKIEDFLLRIGISLQQAKQSFKFLSKQHKDKLFEKIMVQSQASQQSETPLPDITFLSFIRQVDFSTNFMPSEYAAALLSALQSPQQKGVDLQSISSHRSLCFWNAYNLFAANADRIIEHIQMYKKTSRLINQQAINIVERGHVIKYPPFYFVNIRKDSDLRKSLQHPYILIRLAYLLMRIQESRRSKKQGGIKPIIVSLHDVEVGNCTVVGVVSEQKNSFGLKFSEATQKLHLNVKQDYFMTNIMILPKQNLLEFISQVGKDE